MRPTASRKSGAKKSRTPRSSRGGGVIRRAFSCPWCLSSGRANWPPIALPYPARAEVSGAGRKADVAYLYAECNESLRAYGLPKHRHLSEIEQELTFAAGEKVVITFVPHLAPMTGAFIRPFSRSRRRRLLAAIKETLAGLMRRAICAVRRHAARHEKRGRHQLLRHFRATR